MWVLLCVLNFFVKKKYLSWNCLNTLILLYYWRLPLSTHLSSLYLHAFVLICSHLWKSLIFMKIFLNPFYPWESFLFMKIFFMLEKLFFFYENSFWILFVCENLFFLSVRISSFCENLFLFVRMSSTFFFFKNLCSYWNKQAYECHHLKQIFE